MDAWLTRARDALAEAAGVPAAELVVDADTERVLLKLARLAAHDSGERINAPLLTYLVGVAAARSGRSAEALAEAVRARQPE